MRRSLKIFWVLLAALGFIAYMGSNSVLMASHATHFVSDKGPHLPQNESGCITCHADGNLQCGENGPFFQPGDGAIDQDEDGNFNLSETNICDPCHSPGGAYDGVNDPQIGVKANWNGGVYEADGTTLKSGKEKWCAGCHDDDPANSKADGSGVDAPNVIGDSDQTYGYYVADSGHGRNAENPVYCHDCHDLSVSHIDGEARTYSALSNNYTAGYRLNTGFPMDIPRIGGGDGQNHFALCYKGCHHEYTDQFNTSSPSTNFRSDVWNPPKNFHQEHLQALFTDQEGQVWDSDWDGAFCYADGPGLCADSAMSCPACHNVHGSPMEANGSLEPNPVMIRHGELISTPGTNDKVPALDFHWYSDTGGAQETADFDQSLFGGLLCAAPKNLDYNHVCWGCHPTGEKKYRREPPSIQIVADDFEQYTDHASIRVKWKRGKDAWPPGLDPSGGPDGSKCMSVLVKWALDPAGYGTVARSLDPIDLTQMRRVNFYVKVTNTSKISLIKVWLRRQDDNQLSLSGLSTSTLQNGVWELVSLPKESFSLDFGVVNAIAFGMFEYDTGQSYQQYVYFDDVRFVLSGP